MSDFHQMQRAMRAMRQAALQRGVIAVMDIGSSKISCLILQFDRTDSVYADDQVGSLAGQAGFRVIGAATTRARGVQFGQIGTLHETEKSLRTALQAAQKMAKLRADHVIACFSGAAPRSYGLAGQVDQGGRAVTEADVGRVLAAVDMPQIGGGRAVLHAQPVNFTLDHRTGLADPRGQSGQDLSVDMHMLTVDGAAISALETAVQRCDLELAGVASSAYTSALACLVDNDKELGAACIDLGGGTSSLSIFLKNNMIYADMVRMGGDLITNDIAIGLQIGAQHAERIKTLHGGVIATGRDDRDLIELNGQTGDWEHDRRTISRTELIGVIRPRVEEILEELRARLEIAGFYDMSSQQIVLTGGASQLPGLEGLAARILGPQIRMGHPMRVHGLPQAAAGPGFSAVVGLALFAAHPQDEWWDFDMPSEKLPSRSLRRAVRWFKDNW